MHYDTFYRQSIAEPEVFWRKYARDIEWYKFPQRILTRDSYNYPLWFEDGMLNACYLTLDKHVIEGHGEEIALIYDSPVTQTIRKISFLEAQTETAKLAGGLKTLEVQKGDCVIIYMPMIPQAVFAMLACARIGATHSVVYGGFAPHELAIRMNDCKPKVLITACSGIEFDTVIPYKPLVDEAINLAEEKPQHVILYNRKLGSPIPFKKYDVDYEALVYGSPQADCLPVESTHPLYVLYTSGTTGKPKGVLRDTGGYLTALKFSMTYLFNVQPQEVFWAASDIGWAVGHSYSVYGPLLNRNTSIIFEGKPVRTPDAGTFWRVIAQHGVQTMSTAPTAIRAIKKEDPEGKLIKQYDLSCLRTQFLAGERCDAATLNWYTQHIPIPVIDNCWQTESGWPMIAIMMGLEPFPYKPGSSGKAVAGYDIYILGEQGQVLKSNEEGYVVYKLPLPPGNLLTILNNPQRFKTAYLDRFPGYYFSGDGGYRDEEGYIFITGRIDDVINVAGHRLSTADMEEVVAAHPAVAECAVVGVQDELKGQIPFALVVIKSGIAITAAQLEQEVIALMRQKMGAVMALKNVMLVQRMPKTRSGKIIRKLLRNIIDHKEFQIPSTIDDVLIIDEIKTSYEQYKNKI